MQSAKASTQQPTLDAHTSEAAWVCVLHREEIATLKVALPQLLLHQLPPAAAAAVVEVVPQHLHPQLPMCILHPQQMCPRVQQGADMDTERVRNAVGIGSRIGPMESGQGTAWPHLMSLVALQCVTNILNARAFTSSMLPAFAPITGRAHSACTSKRDTIATGNLVLTRLQHPHLRCTWMSHQDPSCCPRTST